LFNDHLASGARILELGIVALERHGILGTNTAQALLGDWTAKREAEALRRLTSLLRQQHYRAGRPFPRRCAAAL